MSVPPGFYEIARSIVAARRLLQDPEQPVFVRMVPTPAGNLQQLTIGTFGPEYWLARRPAWVLYAGPVPVRAAPVVVQLTERWAEEFWPSTGGGTSTWGTSTGARSSGWAILNELAPIYRPVVNVNPWPWTQATWRWVWEVGQPQRYVAELDDERVRVVIRQATPNEDRVA